MRAIEALKEARAAGIDITIDNEDLVLQAPAPPPISVLDALSRNKAEIVALLRPGNDKSVEDRHVFDHEYAGIRPSRISAETETPGISFAAWKAAALNRLFQEQGTNGEPGQITSATVRRGERKTGDA